jgi:hypothetical protein
MCARHRKEEEIETVKRKIKRKRRVRKKRKDGRKEVRNIERKIVESND